MPSRSTESRKELIEKLAARVRERLAPELAASTERFVRQFYADVPPSDLASRSLDDLYGAALAIWRFGQHRKRGQPKVRIYNPTIDRNGWRCSHSVVEVVNDDMPFLVDSVVAELQRLEAQVVLVVHPILRASRDRRGTLEAINPRDGDGDAAPESFMQIQISEQPEELHDGLRQSLLGVLGDIRIAVADWGAMRERCRELIADLGRHPATSGRGRVDEAIEVLEWMADGRFTFLGYRESELVREGGEVRIESRPGLGLLRDPATTVFDGVEHGGTLPHDLAAHFFDSRLLRIAKGHRRSTVHRAVHLDTVAIKRFGAAGEIDGERLFVGLFTQEAYSQSPQVIPLLRRKVANILERSGLRAGSHDARALLHILETYPRDELFQASEDELLDTSIAILNLQDRAKTALFTRRDPFGRFVSCIVYLPRDRYDTRMRRRFEAILRDAYGGEVDRFYTHLSDAALARLQFILSSTRDEASVPPDEEIERRMIEATRSWEDRLAEALIEELGEARGNRLARRYGASFPPGFQAQYNEQMAVVDVCRLEDVVASGELAINLYRPIEAQPHEVKLKIYLAGQARLSDVVPMLENLGLQVIEERPHQVRPADLDRAFWIRDFSLATADDAPIDLSRVRDNFHETFRRVWKGEMSNDGFNKLVLSAGLEPRQVTVLRAYSRFLRQVRIPFSQSYMQATLHHNPVISRRLVELFICLFDPDADEGAADRGVQMAAEIEGRLEEVANLDEDRILRRFLNAVQATLRTNYFQGDEQGRPKPYLAFKLDSTALEALPLPRPFREIFVFSTRVEAIHLRGGPVARGGIRWSDRREDFRTEVLGLMKAQMVKNAVIVPVGSKGGFVVKRPPSSREELMEEVKGCYQTLIRALLDLTDNLRGEEIVPPPRVVRRDGDDPYLVVAADKGTATFSDVANEISAQYGFWLDDAFASGGSAGYDHKKMGITARGAWESVKRHFRELGKNIQEEEFSVVGVGDMSGDVFGNAMLLSKKIRLLGAFNHLHVFVDPSPDPEKSWEERRRLFALARSSWADYDPELISPGGGVFDRKAKSIPVTAEMRGALQIEGERLTPGELIQALLAARVDLLWFGGIGTFVKATEESHAEVDDRANDPVRIDAGALQAAVIGEGANLAVTQRGRVEASLVGVRLNTDAIDNSAGVDCSDHEVNIKILLGEIEANGDMTRKRRNQLLAQMTGEVAELVLRDNYLQTQAITVTHQLGARLLDRVARYMRRLEKRGRLNRRIERLPDEETLVERSSQGIGFTRPELAVLLSYAKIDLYDGLLDSDLPDDPSLDEDLKLYFPRQIRKLFGGRVPRHRLRRELIATILTNDIVNRAGIAFVHEVQERTGMPPARIARAFLISREVFGLRDLWRQIERLDNRSPATLQAGMLLECGRLIERETVWFLRSGDDLSRVEACIERYREGVQTLAANIARLITQADRRELDSRARDLAKQGAPPDLARCVAALHLLAPAGDIVRIAHETGAPVASAGGIHFAVGSRFGFDWLRRAAGRLPTDSAWDKQAINAIIDDLYGHQTELTRQVLRSAGREKLDFDAIEMFAESRRPLLARTEQLLAELQSVATPSLAMLAVANRQLRSLSA